MSLTLVVLVGGVVAVGVGVGAGLAVRAVGHGAVCARQALAGSGAAGLLDKPCMGTTI